jgi:hypothetical protein
MFCGEGLQMNESDLKERIRVILHQAMASSTGSSPTAPLRIPLRIRGPQDAKILMDLVARLSCMPDLAKEFRDNKVRLDVQLCLEEPWSAGLADCSCQSKCECAIQQTGPNERPESAAFVLEGLVSEKRVNQLPNDIKQVVVDARCVVTPLARQAFRQRGIQVIKDAKS